jgi:hypothetical protein
MSPIGRLLVLGAAVAALGALGLSCGQMDLFGSVEVNGHVRLAAGTPLEGVKILFHFPEEPESRDYEVFTNGDGRYRFWCVKPSPLYQGEVGNWRHFWMKPILEGYTFTPPEVDAVASEDEQTYDFTAVPVSTFRAEYYLIVWSWLESR